MRLRDKVQFYKAADGWRWRYIASNGRILADGAQGYSRRIDAMRGCERVTSFDLKDRDQVCVEVLP